jgi:hypothetical protein
MKKLLVLLGLVAAVGAATYFICYHRAMASVVVVTPDGTDAELAWLRREFALMPAQYDRVLALHRAYQPVSEAGDLAAREALIAMWQYRAKVSDVLQHAKSMYFELYRVDGSTVVLQEQIRLLEQMSGTAQRAYEAGTTTLQDVLKTKLARDELRTRLVTLAQQRAGLAARPDPPRPRWPEG